MTNQALRPDRRDQRQRRRGISTPLLVIGSIWLGSLGGIAGSVVATKPEERADLPGLLRWISDYPLHAVVIVTALWSAAAWLVWHREQTATASHAGESLVGTLTVQRSVPLTQTEAGQTRQELLDRVRRTWIEGVLDRSLAHVARVELGLAEQPDAVAHPWGALLRQRGQPVQPLPPGTRLSQVAGRFDHQLLVLGAPGAGKTTLLLEYARDLLDQADHDPDARIPVVFHLSGWPAEQPAFTSWLVAEVGLRYGVSKRLAEVLVDQDRLAVLLDGLDEVPNNRREECAAAINAFRAEHGGVPLVICARSREYHDLADRLTLNGAVEVQPLDREQVDRWFSDAGPRLTGLRSTLRDRSHWLWELLDNPLLLSVAALTYQDQPAAAIRADGSLRVLLDAYVEAMLARPRAPLAVSHEQGVYEDTNTVRWLAWLAQQMGAESVFYPDWMQPDWLPTRAQQWLVTTGVGLITTLVVGFAVAVSLVALAEWDPAMDTSLGVSLAYGLFLGLLSALLVAMLIGLGRQHSRIRPVSRPRWSWLQAGIGLLAGLFLGLVGVVSEGLLVGLEAGLATGVAVWLALGFLPRPNLRPAAPLEGIRAAARAARTVLLVVGIGSALAMGPMNWQSAGLLAGLAAALGAALFFGLPAALAVGGATYIRHRLLCVLLVRRKLLPDDLIGFLDYADSRILMHRVGGGYLFVHRRLQDHFAAKAKLDSKPAEL